MDHSLALIIALIAPALVLMGLRANSAMVFLSLCLGEVLVLYVGTEATDILKGSLPHISQISTSTLQVVVLLAPAVVTGILTAFSVHGRLKNLGNVFPAVAASALAILLAVPLLPAAVRLGMQSQDVWRYISNAQALVVGVGGLASLMFLWTQRRHFKQPEKKK